MFERVEFREKWRKDILTYEYLKRGWDRIEHLGLSYEWTKDAKTEEEWSDVMFRVNEWQRRWEEENNVPFKVDLDFYGVQHRFGMYF